MGQRIEKGKTTIKDAVQALCLCLRRGSSLTTSLRRQRLTGFVMTFLQSSVIHPRQFLFVAVTDGLVGGAVLCPAEKSSEKPWSAGLVVGS